MGVLGCPLLLRLKTIDLAARSICLRFPSCEDLPVPPLRPPPSRWDPGRVRLASQQEHLLWPCPHLMLQLLRNLLDPPQRLRRLQLLQAKQGQAQLILLQQRDREGGVRPGARETAAALPHMPPMGTQRWLTGQAASIWKHPCNAENAVPVNRDGPEEEGGSPTAVSQLEKAQFSRGPAACSPHRLWLPRTCSSTGDTLVAVALDFPQFPGLACGHTQTSLSRALPGGGA